jgi:thiamine biosynthesis protein ThiI
VEIEAIHFASMPYTSQQALNKVKQLARLLSGYQGRIKVHVIPFTDLQLAIYKNCDEEYAITVMRRMMFRIAEAVARNNNCLALVSGESIGQVASQTLESINVINAVTAMPVIRPVVTCDKLEIIAMAEQIGTYKTSILPYEDCCTIFTPKNPVTKPHRYKAEKQESFFDWQPLVDQCVRQCEDIVIYPTTQFDEDTAAGIIL